MIDVGLAQAATLDADQTAVLELFEVLDDRARGDL